MQVNTLQVNTITTNNMQCNNCDINNASIKQCDIHGDSSINGSLTVTGNIFANHGYFTDYITIGYSDVQLKNKIEDLTDCVNKVSELSCYLYKPYEWACKKYGILSKERYGLSAQEVQKVFPASVTRAVFDNTYLSLDYDMLIPVLIKCIQELNNRLISLEVRNLQ